MSKMINAKYANEYKEVLAVLNNLVKEDYEKIPKEYIEFFETNCNNDYDFEYDTSKSFAEQDLLDDTKYILFGLFEKFGATEMQKSKIKAFRTSYYNKLEEEKRQKYNPDDIFKKDERKIAQEKSQSVELVEYKKESFFVRVINRIKNIFKIL